MRRYNQKLKSWLPNSDISGVSMGIMRHFNFRELLVILCSSFYAVNCENSPNLNWQFDPFSTDQWFKQKLDHYDTSNIQHWPQRYVTSYRFYRLGGPIFLYLSGPGPELTLSDIESGAIAEYAQEQGAFVIGLEHRFYGKSRPAEDLSTANLHFLTVPQTLEDIAAFVRQWRSREEFKHSKWVLFGASYLGSVATWFAQKHPELIDAFVASSAPLELRYEIPEFLENVGVVLNQTDPKCYDTIAEGFSCLQNIFNEIGCGNFSLEDVKTKFNFCADLDPTRPLDASGAIAELFSTVNAVVMYHDPDPKSFPDTNLDRFCRHITREDADKTALDKIGEKVKEINEHRKIPCAEFRFETTVKFLDEKEWDSDAAKEGYRQLQWQLCNELGWTVTSANISQPFGNYLSPFLHAEICQKLFGLTETEMRLKVLQANTELKGKEINTQCGIFVNGDKDPWHTYSITTVEEAGKCNRAVLIEGGSHGRDIEDFSYAPSHPPQVREAQFKIAHLLDFFLKTGKCCEEDPSPIRILSSYPRPVRAPNPEEYFKLMNEIKRKPMNVQIRSRGEATTPNNNDRLAASPTSMPLVVSTTDVLSVSPRIPVTSEEGSLEGKNFDENMYRDPRNAEFRKYRVVKLLRHRPSYAPMPEHEASPAPSMEQFEADFPEHSIRVEGRVERVYKNGSKINPYVESKTEYQIPSPRLETDDERLELYNKGRKHLLQTASPYQAVSPTPKALIGKGSGEDEEDEKKKQHFKYVVKQVFRDVVGSEEFDRNEDEEEDEPSILPGDFQARSMESMRSKVESTGEFSNSPISTDKLENSSEDDGLVNVKNQNDAEGDGATVSSGENGSYEPPEATIEEDDTEPNDQSSAQIKKRESLESSSNEDYSAESREKVGKPQTRKIPKKSTVNVKDRTRTKQQNSKSPKKGRTSKEYSSDEDDYYDDDYYYDDDEYDDDEASSHADDDDDDDDDKRKSKKKAGPSSAAKKTNTSSSNPSSTSSSPVKMTNSSTEFTSGEDSRPLRLREKISEKIMSSSEDVDGDQKSKEKADGSRKRGKSRNQQEATDDGGNEDELLEDSGSSSSRNSKELYSDEDYNYSLEPSGSDPQGQYKKSSKKQLVPITKSAIEQPSTVINVEISGSYPKRISHRHRKKSKKTTTTEAPVTSTLVYELLEDAEKLGILSSGELTKNETQHKKRVVVRRRKVKKHPKQNTTTTSTTPSTTTTTSPSTTTESSVVKFTDNPTTNNYATWNRARFIDQSSKIEAKPIQHEAPAFVSLENKEGTPSPVHNNNDDLNQRGQEEPQGEKDKINNNDAIYIIIGDIPAENEGENEVNNGPPSHDALFKFIQKLVSRHSSGMFERKLISQTPAASRQNYYPQTLPQPSPMEVFIPPAGSNTAIPSPLPYHPPPPQPPRNLGYDEHTGKYLLVRPVQIVPLGREHVVHAHDLKNESLIELMTKETPLHPYANHHQNQFPNTKRQNSDSGGAYEFKSLHHRDNFEQLLSVDGQVRDSDRNSGPGRYRNNISRRLDQVPDPSWRSIRGLAQFGPAIPPSAQGGTTSGLLSLSAADTQWVAGGVPFLPRGSRHMVRRGVQYNLNGNK